MTDAGFPVIDYPAEMSPRDRGLAHGEAFRRPIGELARIRRELMVQKNPQLTPPRIASLAAEQWGQTTRFDSALAEELSGIADGSGLRTEDIVVLNNYTDFRDIEVVDQGCSVVYVNRRNPIAGQTWDMHASAKNYVCCLRIEGDEPSDRQIVFSLVGCLGLMGYAGRGLVVGVNNINTTRARPGVVWPALVRHLLCQPDLAAIRQSLISAPITSGRSFLIASSEEAEFWEVMPDLADLVSRVARPDRGHLFHTNHCLGERAKLREIASALSSTTHVRYALLKKKIGQVQSWEDVQTLLNDHENYPQSICSNFQSGVQDPSVTCGGALGDLSTGKVTMWRGDAMYDANFVQHEFDLGRNSDG